MLCYIIGFTNDADISQVANASQEHQFLGLRFIAFVCKSRTIFLNSKRQTLSTSRPFTFQTFSERAGNTISQLSPWSLLVTVFQSMFHVYLFF